MKIKPCPNVLCNSKNVLIVEDDWFEFDYYGHCEDCGLYGESFKTKQEAKDSWNTRPETGLEKFNCYWKRNGIYTMQEITDKIEELLAEENL